MSARRMIAFLPVAVALSFGACDCGDGGLEQLERLLVVDVERLSYADTYVGGARALDVTLTSAGTAPVSLSNDALSGAAAFVVTSSVPDVIVAGGSISIEIAFAPTEAGELTGAWTVDSDAQNNDRVSVALEGTALAALDCDDDNTCTADSFDADEGVCVHVAIPAPCDDGSACTEGDLCVNGACVGDAIDCRDDVECTLDVCDPAVGCRFVPQNDACADPDPCTLDVCEPSSGCTNPPAPDGTPCGDLVLCQTIDVCILQVCTELEIPEGTPCTDGDVCTLGDACAGGVCAGEESELPPAVIAETVRVGITATVAIVGDRIVAADPMIKVLRLDDSAPGVRAPAHPEVFAIAGDGTHAVAAERVVQPEGAPAIPMLRLTVIDPLAPAADDAVAIETEGDGLGTFFVDRAHAFFCTDFNELQIADLVTGAVTALAGQSPLCTRALGPLSAHDGLALTAESAQAGAGPASPLVVHELVFDAAPIAHPIARPDELLAVDRTYFHGGLGAVTSATNATRVALVDARDLAAPIAAMANLPPGAYEAVAIRAPYLYFRDDIGFGRMDIDDIAAPVVDATWRANVPLFTFAPYGFIADEAHALWFSTTAGSLWLVDLVAGGTTPLPGQGSFGPVLASRSTDGLAPGALLSAQRQAITVVTSPFTDGTPQSAITSLVSPVVITTPTLAGLFAPLVSPTGNGSNPEVGPLAPTYALRADARAPIVRNTDPHGIPGHVTIDDNGAIGAIDIGISVAWPEAVDAFYAPAANGCIGAALATPDDADCVFPGCPADLHVLSFCNGAVDVAPLTSVPLPAFLENELPIVSSYAHGTTVSFYGAQNAAVVELADPLSPTVRSFPVEELVNARFANGAAQGNNSLSIVQGAGGAPPVALLVRLADNLPVNVERWELAPGSGDDIRRRVLGVAWPRGFISDWSGPSVHEGHRVDIYDISVSPPVVTDSIPIASEPTGLSIQDNGDLVVVRGDGITIISPPCGP